LSGSVTGKYQSRCDHRSKNKSKHKDEQRFRKKESRGKARAMVGASDIDSSVLHLELEQQ
jgi:hypothetical protein